METKQIFNSPTLGGIDIGRLVEEIAVFLTADPTSIYHLVIGTDSHKNGTPESADFVTAVVVHRQGHGARYFWKRCVKGNIRSLRDKIYQETLLSLDLAEVLVPKVRARVEGSESRYDLEIHIDVGRNGPTREMIREVVGMVVGNGYTAKTKPEAYGAFVVADRHA
jgi:hypothetical protein